MKLNLTANNQQEELILNYLEKNASEILAEKINNGVPFEKDGQQLINKKNLTDFMKFACSEAQKLAKDGARSICIEDKTVYGWAIHYFEEDSIEGKLYTADGQEYKPIATQKTKTKAPTNKKPKSKKKKNGQLSFFDLLDNTDDINAEQEIKEETTTNKTQESIQIKPFYQEYQKLETKYPKYVILQRQGDFYEVFGEKAIQLANLTELTLTSRDCGTKERVPMIGFPYHAADNYFNKILEYMNIAIVENKNVSLKLKTNPTTSINVKQREEKPKTPMERYEEICKAYPDFIIAIEHKNLYRIYGENAKTLSKEFYFTLFQENGYEYISFPKRQHFISIITQTHNLAIGSCLEDIEFYIENNQEGRIQCL